MQFGRVMCGMSERVVERTFQEIAEGVSDARKEMLEYIEDHPRFELIGTKMLDAWNTGVSSSLLSEKRSIIVDLGKNQKPAPNMKGPDM